MSAHPTAIAPAAEAARRRAGWLYVLVTVAIWAGFVTVARIGGTSALTPWDVTGVRFLTGGLLLLPFWLWRGRRPALFDRRMLALVATGGVGYCITVFWAFRYAPASHGGILLSGLLPFEIAVVSWLMNRERPSRARVIGLVAVAAGAACLAVDVWRVAAGPRVWLGDLLLVAASSIWAVYTVLVRRWQLPGWDATLGCALLSALLYLPLWALLLPSNLANAPWQDIALQAFYQGVLAVVVAMITYMKAVELLGASATGTAMALVPACAGVLAVLVLDEPVTAWLVTGMVLVSAGALWGARAAARQGR